MIPSYRFIMFFKLNNIKSKQIHDVRKFLRNKAEIIIGKKTLLKYYLQTKQLFDHDIHKQKLSENLNNNVGLIFTNIDPYLINKYLSYYNLKDTAKAGTIAKKDIKIKKGIKPLSPSQTSFFQALGIPTRVTKGSIEILENILLVKKDKTITSSHEVLLKKLNIRPFKHGFEFIEIMDRYKTIPLKYLSFSRVIMISNINTVYKKLMSSASYIQTETPGFQIYNINHMFNKTMAYYLTLLKPKKCT
mmetsp:Transcript_1128/g.1569  ORF Transcript_1128/g.1569 Transcript_1128/m.1569 type:complete len:246 (-) Transcript_1128:96-833(-)